MAYSQDTKKGVKTGEMTIGCITYNKANMIGKGGYGVVFNGVCKIEIRK